MAFVSELEVVPVLAGNSAVDSLSEEPPQKTTLRNIYFSRNTPKYNGAYYVRGNSVEHSKVYNGDYLLWRSINNSQEISKGDIVALSARVGNPETEVEFNSAWKCLSVVKKISECGNYITLSRTINNKETLQNIPFSEITSKMVYAFNP